MPRLTAADLRDDLLQSRVRPEHLAEVDDWIESEARTLKVPVASIADPLTVRARLAASYKLGAVVCRALAGQNQRAMQGEADVYVTKRSMYMRDLADLLPSLTASDWSGLEEPADGPSICITLGRG